MCCTRRRANAYYQQHYCYYYYYHHHHHSSYQPLLFLPLLPSQEHQNTDIYEKAVKIIETYFGTDEDENVAPNATSSSSGGDGGGGFAFTAVTSSQGFDFPAAAAMNQSQNVGFN